MSENNTISSSFDKRVKNALNQKLKSLPLEKQREIQTLRRESIQRFNIQKQKTVYLRFNHWGMVTAIFAIIVFGLISLLQQPAVIPSNTIENQLAINSDDIELYEQLDFYLWLHEMEQNQEQLS